MLNVPSNQGGRALRRYMHGFSYLTRQLVLTSDTMWGSCGPTYNRLAETECQKICPSALEAQLSKSKTSSPKCAESCRWVRRRSGSHFGVGGACNDARASVWHEEWCRLNAYPVGPAGTAQMFLTWTHFASLRVQMAGPSHLQAEPSRSKLGQSR